MSIAERQRRASEKTGIKRTDSLSISSLVFGVILSIVFSSNEKGEKTSGHSSSTILDHLDIRSSTNVLHDRKQTFMVVEYALFDRGEARSLVVRRT